MTNFNSLRYFKEIVDRFIQENDLDEFKHTNFTENKDDLYKRGIAYLEKYFISNSDSTEIESKKNAKFYQNHLLNVYKNKFFKAVNIFEAISKKFTESSEVISEVREKF